MAMSNPGGSRGRGGCRNLKRGFPIFKERGVSRSDSMYKI